MNTDIRKNRDYSKVMSFKKLWLQEQFKKLRKIYETSEISNDEIRELLLKEYEGRRLVKGRFYSNTDGKNEVMDQEQFIDYFLNQPLILSGYSTLYKNQENSINIGAQALKFLTDSRSIFKKRMEESEYGSDQYIYYRILQLTFKVLANSYYGILGERNSVFYNSHVQNSITMTGQDLITSSIISLENFLADNLRFRDFDDLINFVEETLDEKPSEEIMKYLDEPVLHKELIEYLKSKTDNIDEEMFFILAKVVNKLSLEQVNKLYYKNKLLKFLSNSSFMKNKFSSIVSGKDSELDSFSVLIKEFTFSNMIFEDRFNRVIKMNRKNVVVSDTDSAFVNFSNYIQESFKLLNIDESEQNQLSILNVFINIVTKALQSSFEKITEHMGLVDSYKTIINMKNEFVYKRIMLTRNKKSYGGMIESELGKMLKKPVPDIKGLSIKKSSVSKVLREKFTEILEEDVLKSQSVNLSEIIKKFDRLGLEIESSLKKGETAFLLPKNIETIDGYKDPSMQEPVRGVLVWNALEPENQIVPPEKINIIKLKTMEKDSPELLKLKQTHPEKYNSIMRVVFNEGVSKPTIDISRFGLSVIAVPKSAERIPEYILPFIDYQSMVNNNMTNGYIILESLGIYTEEVKTTKYKSNIIEI
jgi:hypothetical protein